MVDNEKQCRDSILYRLVLAYFMAHDDWASQHNITIMCRVIPHIILSFPAIMRQTQDTFPHSRNAFLRLRLVRILAHSRLIMHLRISLHIFTSYCAVRNHNSVGAKRPYLHELSFDHSHYGVA